MPTDAIDRSGTALADRAESLLRAEQVAGRTGWLQAVHPVLKLLGIPALIALTVTFETPGPPAAMLGLSVGLAALSRVPLGVHALRTGVPAVVSAVIVAPQLILLPGPTLLGPVSVAGATYVTTFAVRVAAAVSLLGLLISTTRFGDLAGALRTLRVPRSAVVLLTITHRYLLVVFAELARLVLARRSRRIEPAGIRASWREGASLLGTFLLGALDRGERVGRAARARGGTAGRAYSRPRSIGLADAAFAFVVCGTLAAGVLVA